MVLETKTAVKIEAIIPMISVTAKPFIGPVPKLKRKIAAIMVVKLASRMVVKALANPASIAAIGDFPFLNSSRILSKIRTFASTDIPIVRTIPAIPGRVSAALNRESAPKIIIMFIIRAMVAFTPARL